MASLKLKRRTKFRAIPARRSTNMSQDFNSGDITGSKFGRNHMNKTELTDKKSREREPSVESNQCSKD